MVVAASFGEEGRPVIATFTEDVPNGARLNTGQHDEEFQRYSNPTFYFQVRRDPVPARK